MATKNMHEAINDPDKDRVIVKMTTEALRLAQRLDNGRHYLMGVRPKELNVEDALEAFGFSRDGLNDNDNP